MGETTNPPVEGATPETMSGDIPPESAPAPAGLTCPECGDWITPNGRWPAAATLGLHRSQKHGIKGVRNGTRTRKPRKASVADTENVRPLSLVSSAASGIKGKGTPTKDQLAGAMGRFTGYGSLLVAMRLVDDDPRPMTDEQRSELVYALMITPAEGAAITAPAARLLAATDLNKRYGRTLVDNTDVLDAFGAAIAIMDRWRAYNRDRAGAIGTVSPIIPGMPGPEMGPTRGVVMTPDMVPGRDPNTVPGRIPNAAPEV